MRSLILCAFLLSCSISIAGPPPVPPVPTNQELRDAYIQQLTNVLLQIYAVNADLLLCYEFLLPNAPIGSALRQEVLDRIARQEYRKRILEGEAQRLRDRIDELTR